MPKYEPTGKWPPFVGWLLAGLLLLLLLWGIWEKPFILILIGVIATWSILDIKRRNSKLKKLSEERSELSICEFARSFDRKVIDTWVIRAVYEQIQEYVATSDYVLPIKADDDLEKTIEIDDEDLDMDILVEILQRTGRSMKDTESNPFFGKVKTVSDLVYFVNEQPIVTNT